MNILFVAKDFLIEPLGLLYLSASLKAHGHTVKLLRIGVIDEGVVANEQELLLQVKRFSPDIILYSVTTGMHQYYLNMNRFLKEHAPFLAVFGGMHPTFFPAVLDESGVYVICRGEGEDALVELANTLEKGKEITTIKNLWVKQHGRVYKNEFRPFIEDLDRLPFPDRELIYKYERFRTNPIKNFITTRGCPHSCTYCFNHSLFKLYGNKRTIRSRSPEKVIEEIKAVQERYPMKLVYFQDDILALNAHFTELMDLYRKEIALPFHAHIRPDLITREIAQKLKTANCLSLTMSAESGNDHIRNDILKRNMSRDTILNAARILHDVRIKFRMENMVGLPNETLNDAFDTLELNIQCKPALGWASIFQPYPATELWDYTIGQGIYDGNVNEFKPSFFESSVLKLANKKEIENLQKLFSITVSFPFLKHLTKVLVRLPPNRLFKLTHDKWKKYCFDKRLYQVA